MVTISSANAAPARFTSDSIASDSRPTEFVIHHASVFSAIVATATAMETRSSSRGSSNSNFDAIRRLSAKLDVARRREG